MPPPVIVQIRLPPLQVAPMDIYPTLGSLQEVLDLADSKLPISTKNELYALLATYHNTLLKVTQGQQ